MDDSIRLFVSYKSGSFSFNFFNTFNSFTSVNYWDAHCLIMINDLGSRRSLCGRPSLRNRCSRTLSSSGHLRLRTLWKTAVNGFPLLFGPFSHIPSVHITHGESVVNKTQMYIVGSRDNHKRVQKLFCKHQKNTRIRCDIVTLCACTHAIFR